MTTKTRPTPKKLPRARVMWANDASYEINLSTVSLFRDAPNAAQKRAYKESPLAVIPTHTAAQAKRIVKAAPFLQLTEGEQMVLLAMAIADNPDNRVLAVLRCMGLGGRGGE